MYGRVLVVQTAFLGDLVLTQPLVEELARALAPAPVDLLVRAPFAPIARGFRGVAEVLPFDKRGADRGVSGFLRQRAALRARGYAVSVTPHRSFRTGLLLRAAGIPRRVGFAGSPGAAFLTDRVATPPGAYPERLRGLLLAVGAGPGPDDPALDVDPAVADALAAKLRAAGVGDDASVVALNPGSVWATKRWLPEGFAEVCRALSARGFTPVLVGGRDDAPVTAEVARLAGAGTVDFAAKTSLPELAALARRARVFVSNDSGPMHIAAAVGTPVVAIFGPTTPALGFAPRIRASEIVERALECRPCHKHGPKVCPLGHFRCMREIGAGEVLSAAERLVPEIAGVRRAPGAEP